MSLDQQIDLKKARDQHKAYVDALRRAGLAVTTLPADEKHADCVFTEDAAVIVGDHALVTNPGVASRKVNRSKPEAPLALTSSNRTGTHLTGRARPSACGRPSSPSAL